MMQRRQTKPFRTLTGAMESLDVACRAPRRGRDGVAERARATMSWRRPSLVALLLRVVMARRLVSQLELDVKAELRNQTRASTVS